MFGAISWYIINIVKYIKAKALFCILVVCTLFYVSHLSLYAESQIPILDEDISIELTPRNPEPYKDVTIALTSYSTDLNKAVISWQINGQTVQSGIGKIKHTLKAGGPDSIITVTINIVPVGSVTSLSKKIIIRPQEMDLMWESVDGYTPPFYKGKSLPIIGGSIKVVAIPNSTTIKSGSGSITYKWKNNGEVVSDSSGYNKNYYVFRNDILEKDSKISVLASSVSGDYSSEKSININMFKPKLLFYKKSPSEGILYNNSLQKEESISENEMTIVAEPYYFPNKNVNTIYTWKINGEPIQTPSKKTELTVRPTSSGGYATINLTIKNVKDFFQEVSNNLKLNL